eukprot:scaffold8563_cov97-Isochrysis_galbana.AAC.2
MAAGREVCGVWVCEPGGPNRETPREHGSGKGGGLRAGLAALRPVHHPSHSSLDSALASEQRRCFLSPSNNTSATPACCRLHRRHRPACASRCSGMCPCQSPEPARPRSTRRTMGAAGLRAAARPGVARVAGAAAQREAVWVATAAAAAAAGTE